MSENHKEQAVYGFSASIPTHLFSGRTIEHIVVGASSLKFVLDRNMDILFLYYGTTDNKEDWLYHLPLCGEHSVQGLVGLKIENFSIEAIDVAKIKLSDGKIIKIIHDNVNMELVRFNIDGAEYIA